MKKLILIFAFILIGLACFSQIGHYNLPIRTDTLTYKGDSLIVDWIVAEYGVTVTVVQVKNTILEDTSYISSRVIHMYWDEYADSVFTNKVFKNKAEATLIKEAKKRIKKEFSIW